MGRTRVGENTLRSRFLFHRLFGLFFFSSQLFYLKSFLSNRMGPCDESEDEILFKSLD